MMDVFLVKLNEGWDRKAEHVGCYCYTAWRKWDKCQSRFCSSFGKRLLIGYKSLEHFHRIELYQ